MSSKEFKKINEYFTGGRKYETPPATGLRANYSNYYY
jgi:hypothetical protein